jgi:D-alanyl-D-alanine dipeptidase
MLLASTVGSAAAELPPGFVYLRTVDPTISQEMRYAGWHNFTGRPVAGYEAAECILSRRAADALKRVQDRLRGLYLTLKVYDCYRPEGAVAAFAEWAEAPGDIEMKSEFYPGTDKGRLFEDGWIARRSAHSRGSTVDLTIVPLPPPRQRAYRPGEPLTPCDAAKESRFPDNSLDFGTGFDCFSPRSHTADAVIAEEAKGNRALLVDVMAEAGFENYRREWWHFELSDEPFPSTFFDFPIVAQPF